MTGGLRVIRNSTAFPSPFGHDCQGVWHSLAHGRRPCGRQAWNTLVLKYKLPTSRAISREFLKQLVANISLGNSTLKAVAAILQLHCNLQTLCGRCNLGKSDSVPTPW